MSIRLPRLTCVLAAVTLATCALPAAAQTPTQDRAPSAPPRAAPASTPGGQAAASSRDAAPSLPRAGLGDVVVTATRVPRAAADLVADVSVIDETRMRNADPWSLVDLLRQEPGVQGVSSGGPASVSSIFLRGANPGQTLVLVEGFRIGSASAGTPTLEGLPPAAFGRAEILRGPASGLYGADSIGGVVQLFLRRGHGEPAAFGEAGYGSWNTRSLTAGVGGASGGVDYSLAVSGARSGGFDATLPGSFAANPDRDGYRRSDLAFNGNVRLAPGHEIGIVALEDHLDTQFDEGPVLADARTHLVSRLLGLHSSHALGDRVRLRLRAGTTIDDNTAISQFPGEFRSEQRQYGADVDWSAGAATTLSLGVERLDQRVNGSSYDPGTPGSRTTDSLRAALHATLGAQLVELAVRHDADSQYGGKTTGRAAWGYRFDEALRASVAMATGFRAPSFNDLYFPGFGRSSIRPESARSAELGLYYDAPRSHARAVLFRTRVRDLIVFQPVCPDPSPQFVFGCADNVGRARIDGLSLAWTRLLAGWRVSANVDLLRPEDESLGKRLPRRATRTANLLVEHRSGPAAWALEWTAQGARFDDPANAVRLGGYALVNARVELPIGRGWSAFARVNNLLDKRYVLASGFVTPSVNLFAGIRYAPGDGR